MKLKHLIVGAVMTAFSLLALAAPETATPPAASAAATSAPAASKPAATPATKAKSAKKAEQGKTRGLKSKRGKECDSDNGCNGGFRQ